MENKKLTGVELIVQERQKQIDKYGFTGEHHANRPEWYDSSQLLVAAENLLFDESEEVNHELWCPINWDLEWWLRLCAKPFKERLVVSSALIAAELDRLNELEP